jgi:hypothetical protein
LSIGEREEADIFSEISHKKYTDEIKEAKYFGRLSLRQTCIEKIKIMLILQ